MAGQCKKQGGLGIFGGSGEGMYYGVFGLAARCERSKPPRPGKHRLYPKKTDFKRKPAGGLRGRERQRRDTDNIIYMGHRIL